VTDSLWLLLNALGGGQFVLTGSALVALIGDAFDGKRGADNPRNW